MGNFLPLFKVGGQRYAPLCALRHKPTCHRLCAELDSWYALNVVFFSRGLLITHYIGFSAASKDKFKPKLSVIIDTATVSRRSTMRNSAYNDLASRIIRWMAPNVQLLGGQMHKQTSGYRSTLPLSLQH
jgi:hypothetical protein